MSKPALHTIVFRYCDEDRGGGYRRPHPYAFVSREAAEKFADWTYNQGWNDGVEILPRLQHHHQPAPALQDDMPF